jgi:hypothetical protein
MTAEALLASLRHRGFQVRLKDGALRVSPYRAASAEVAVDEGTRLTLARLLRECEASARGHDTD